MVAVLEYQPVDATAQLSQRVRLVVEAHGLHRGQYRNLERHHGKLPGGDRRKARVAKGGRHRVRLHVLGERAMWPQRPDAAAQLGVPREGDEAGAVLLQPLRCLVFLPAHPELVRNCRSRKRQQHAACIPGQRIRFPSAKSA